MTSIEENPSYGPPPPITELTTEQDFRMRQLEILLPKDEVVKEDIVTLLLALQKQNFILSNSMMNLVKSWPRPLDNDLVIALLK